MVNLDESTDEIEDDSKQTWSEAFNPDNDYEADYEAEQEQHREAPNTTYKGERENAIMRFYHVKHGMITLNFEDKGKVYMINVIEANSQVTLIDIYVGDIDAKSIIQNVKWIDTIRLGPDPQEQY